MNGSDSLGDRLKKYEYISTSRQLMPCTPVYARIDGRHFHTFCRGLEKPFSKVFIAVMQETCKFLVEETNACLGYVQSDEISLGWESIVKAPFDGRLQKLESNLASLASAKFVKFVYDTDLHRATELLSRIQAHIPSFDCRVFNVPTMTELANCFLWRENDAIKNSISGMALNFYSHKELQNKNSDEKIHMMRMKGFCFYEDTDPAFMRGTFYHRENYLKDLTDEEVSRIPEKQRANLVHECGNTTTNHYACWRSHIVPMNLPYRLTETQELEGVLFNGANPECKIENPTFVLLKERR